MTEAPTSRTRKRASHSLEAIVTEAVALLDEAGEQALTFRALAARLGGGVGSIYWYVDSRDELLDRASDHVLADVLTRTAHLAHAGNAAPTSDPIDDIREIAVVTFDAVNARPWLGAYFMRDTGTQPNGLALYERLGEQTLRLNLTRTQRFNAVSAVMGFVIGVAADLSQEVPPEVASGAVTVEEYQARFAQQWRESDPAAFPFLHHIVDEFAAHDDADQFRAGLDLLLAGLRNQAGSTTS